MVAAVFVITFVGFGCAYTFGSFLEPLQRDFGASRGAISLVFSLAGFLYFGLGVVAGPMADQWGAKKPVALGMVLIGLGLMLASRAQSIEQVYLAYGLGVGLGLGCAYVPALGVVQHWFVRRRGLASGLAVSGIGVGTLVMPPLATWLIASFGWRSAYVSLGVLALVLGLGAARLIVDHPQTRALGPDGDPAPLPTATPPKPGLTTREAIRTPRFIGMYVACLLCAIGIFVPFVHLVPYAQDHQIASAQAVLLLGLVGVGSTAARFFLGGVADRMGRDAFQIVMYIGMAASLGVWAIARDFWSLAAFATLFGLIYGGWVAILPAVVADHFGARHVGAILGTLYTSAALGTLLGPTAAGFAFDVSHSYVMPIAICAVANVLAAGVALLTLRTPSPMAAV